MEAVVHVFLLINPVKSLERSWAGDKQGQKLAGGGLCPAEGSCASPCGCSASPAAQGQAQSSCGGNIPQP